MNPLKALTVKQPWAWAILFAGKDIENRSWSTSYRGPLVIHAGASMHDGSLPGRLPTRIPTQFDMSALVGIVDLVDVVEHSRSRWFEGDFGWVLQNPRPFDPIACKGKLRLWSLSPSQLNAVKANLRRAGLAAA
jgi:hypothetical protein